MVSQPVIAFTSSSTQNHCRYHHSARGSLPSSPSPSSSSSLSTCLHHQLHDQPLASSSCTACSCLITEEKAYGITVTCINQNSWWWRGECFDLNVDNVHHDEECEEQDQYSWHYQLDVLQDAKVWINQCFHFTFIQQLSIFLVEIGLGETLKIVKRRKR